ncbi:hypothetical protein [Mucilaginibacter sp.]|uniref:hypothetical protein n=1 Tax=Mucilaginibacter sp. TaxID=1882438 RepID=UPI00283B2267|nr:hypothetical protein [Mucilaginibacter sp.]MDR3695212.1 hypothetical protein [Mucilaginibacter sp.]
MNIHPQWFLIDSEQGYNEAIARYEEVKRSPKNTDEHREKMLLVHLIEMYENSLWDFPEVDPIKMIKIRMEDFGYKPSDLAAV